MSRPSLTIFTINLQEKSPVRKAVINPAIIGIGPIFSESAKFPLINSHPKAPIMGIITIRKEN